MDSWRGWGVKCDGHICVEIFAASGEKLRKQRILQNEAFLGGFATDILENLIVFIQLSLLPKIEAQ